MFMLRRLEELPIGSFHYKMLLVTGLGWLFDAMDTGLIAFVLPLLVKDWGLSPAQAGWIGSVGLIGMALGAVVAGSLADRWGRKKVFTATVLLYSVSTGLCALAWSYESLLVFRFLVGFGLGGELPVAVTLMTEYAPTRLRGRFIVLLESFWGVGWLVAACISYLFIPTFGWKLAFLLGALPALYVFLIRLHLPESVRYLLAKGRVEEAKEIVCHLEEKLGLANRPFTADELLPRESGRETGFAALWQKGFRLRTAMLWLTWFGIVFSYYGIFMWLPSLVYAQGFAVVEEQARRLGLWSERTWGPALEDRGSQITFSALGQEAPIDAKRAWDPTGEKRAALRDAVAPLLPGLEVRSGGATSIDITLEGVDKAYGMRRLAEVTGIGLERMLFIGDRLDPEGNDYPVKVLGVPCHAVTGWRDTAEFVTALAGDLAAARGRGK